MLSELYFSSSFRIRPSTRATILVAEDSLDSREMMEKLLQTKGFDVVLAGDGPSAVEMALQTLPDLILIDLQLPKLDGLGVARSLRLNPRTRAIPIVIVSGHDPTKYRQAAMAAGCNGYLLKPLDFERLDSLLQRVISSQRYLTRRATNGLR
jgi:two-component system cell cycle response regulator DivK